MIAILFAAISGVLVVLQTGMNKMMSETWGITPALFLNGITFLVFNLVWFVFVWWQPRLMTSEYGFQGHLSDFRLWWVLPGLFGFLLVMGVTLALREIGAVQAFIISITAQIACSFVWDLAVEGKEFSWVRLTGAAVTVVGALITVSK